jgi:hypothetical protein
VVLEYQDKVTQTLQMEDGGSTLAASGGGGGAGGVGPNGTCNVGGAGGVGAAIFGCHSQLHQLMEHQDQRLEDILLV